MKPHKLSLKFKSLSNKNNNGSRQILKQTPTKIASVAVRRVASRSDSLLQSNLTQALRTRSSVERSQS